MKIRIVCKGSYGAVVVIVDGSVENALDCLEGLSGNYAGSVKGFPALFKRFANGGRKLLPYPCFHPAGEGFQRFSKGKVRVYCFWDETEDRLVLTHCTLKKQDKTSDKDLNKAEKCRKAYHKARQSGKLVIEVKKS